MSYLSDTFGVPLKKQFEPQLPTVTPESLLAPTQPFGPTNAIGTPQSYPAPYLDPSTVSQQSVSPFAQSPVVPSVGAPDPSAVGSVSPVLANLGIKSPVQPMAQGVSENFDTSYGMPSPAELLDMPTRDQAKESKRLTNLAGIGGVLGLLLGGGAGALEGAAGAVGGGREALDFAAQNEAQKVQAENQKRLYAAQNERQAWMDKLTVEDRAYQKQREKDTEEFNRQFKLLQLEANNAKADTQLVSVLNRSAKDTMAFASDQVNDDGTLSEAAQLAIDRHNALALEKGHSEMQINPNGVGPSQRSLTAIKNRTILDEKLRGLGLNNDFLKATFELRKLKVTNESDRAALQNEYQRLVNEYYPDKAKASIAQMQAIAKNLPEYLGLRNLDIKADIARTEAATKAARETKAVKLDPTTIKEINDTASNLKTDGWGKTVSAINKKYADRIGSFQFPATTDKGKDQILAKQERDQEIESAKDALIRRAQGLGFKDVTFNGSGFDYKVPSAPREALENSGNYIGNKPKDFGAWNDKWTDNDKSSFIKIAEGTSNIIKPVSGAVDNRNPVGWRVTAYGYQGEETPDSNSAKGIGRSNNVLKPGDIAVSPDVLAQLKAKYPKLTESGNRLRIVFQKGGKVYSGNFRVADVTDKSIKNTIDIFMPAGKRGGESVNRYSGGSVISVGKIEDGGKSVPNLKVEEVKPSAKPPAKIPPKPAPKKVQSGKPLSATSLNDLRAREKQLQSGGLDKSLFGF